MQACMVDLYRSRATSRERNVIEKTKATISLEAVLATETMQEPQSNLEDKDCPSIVTLFMQWEEIIVSKKDVLLICYATVIVYL